jgi:hypothetical protein
VKRRYEQLLQRHLKLCGRKCLWSDCDVIAVCASRDRGKPRKKSVLPRSELSIFGIQFYAVTVAQTSLGSADCEVALSIVCTALWRGVDHPSQSSTEVRERVELYLYSLQCMIVL